jgi:hypothetical protein
MQTIVITGMLTYSLSYLATAFLLRHYVRESNSGPMNAFDFSNRRYQVNAINVLVAILAMAVMYFSNVG